MCNFELLVTKDRREKATNIYSIPSFEHSGIAGFSLVFKNIREKIDIYIISFPLEMHSWSSVFE